MQAQHFHTPALPGVHVHNTLAIIKCGTCSIACGQYAGCLVFDWQCEKKSLYA